MSATHELTLSTPIVVDGEQKTVVLAQYADSSYFVERVGYVDARMIKSSRRL